ncbi:hypothetical protein TNCV_3269861 [Trichonephila clavipes]|uniref:Uncharacterized protein n=1 Tax=Trichonephila clavipes TaxID=2585209 RepID=A0A8X6S1H8_TRICX|nr:hypothetical protein TNCV_3269861 [Trichonephila clavipes]
MPLVLIDDRLTDVRYVTQVVESVLSLLQDSRKTMPCGMSQGSSFDCINQLNGFGILTWLTNTPDRKPIEPLWDLIAWEQSTTSTNHV